MSTKTTCENATLLPNAELQHYVETQILPRYAAFDAAHQLDHARTVIAKSLQLAAMVNANAHYVNSSGEKLCVDADMIYAAAAYHDTGLCEGRETHHSVSARIIRADKNLLRWFSAEEINVIADAAEDHRASAKSSPRTIYGRIVAEADRAIVPETVILRTMQYTAAHYPGLNKQGQYDRMISHLHEKYAEGGYMKLWIPESENGENLRKLRDLIKNEQKLKVMFNELWRKL